MITVNIVDTPKVKEALAYAISAHDGQLRDGGGEYITHPLKTYQLICQVSDDEPLRCAALLHDTIEDTATTYDDINAAFGQEIADLVNEVTHEGRPDSTGFYFPRLETKRGVMLKFADRLANISEMDAWNEKRQAHYLRKSKFWSNGNEYKPKGAA